MNNKSFLALLLIVVATGLTSCDVVGGIFKAGFWAAIILIVLVAALIIWLLRRFRR